MLRVLVIDAVWLPHYGGSSALITRSPGARSAVLRVHAIDAAWLPGIRAHLGVDHTVAGRPAPSQRLRS